MSLMLSINIAVYALCVGQVMLLSSADVCPFSDCTCTAVEVKCVVGLNQLEASDLSALSSGITSLMIANYHIDKISEKFFARVSNLTLLSVTGCGVTALEQASLYSLTKLIYIDLSGNHLHYFPDGLFIKQNELVSLNLSQNAIDSLEPNQLRGLSSELKILSLRGNHLKILDPTLFDNLTGIQHLDLSDNQLTYILPRAFNHLAHLTVINLSYNLIVTLSESLFSYSNSSSQLALYLSGNPFSCNCGLRWLKENIELQSSTHAARFTVMDSNNIVCKDPMLFYGQNLINVSLHADCQPPTATLFRVEPEINKFYMRTKVVLHCNVTGDPKPSVVWTTPLGDMLVDPKEGAWLDHTISTLSSEKKYQIYATGEKVIFSMSTGDRYSRLEVDSLHHVSSGEYVCSAFNPGGNASDVVEISLNSAIDAQYFHSLLVAICTVGAGILLGVIGCSVTKCIEKCRCCLCPHKLVKYYDGDATHTVDQLSMASVTIEDENSYDEGETSTSNINRIAIDNMETTGLTAEEWDEYFREYPDEFYVESLDGSPRQLVTMSDEDSLQGSPSHRINGRTLETLENVRVRLKLRVEQIDLMKERIRTGMGKRSARMKENMGRRREKMNRKMQTIKDSTSQSLQTIKEHGRNYSHRLHKGVQKTIENVGYHVQSLKELCGTGDLGQTLSIATMVTDVDTNETHEMIRSETMV